MVIDTSALVAILLRKPEADIFNEALAAAPVRRLSAVTRVEWLPQDSLFEVVSVTPGHY